MSGCTWQKISPKQGVEEPDHRVGDRPKFCSGKKLQVKEEWDGIEGINQQREA